MYELSFLTRRWSWAASPARPEPAAPADGLADFLSEDDDPPPPLSARPAAQFATVLIACAGASALAVFLSRPLWAAPVTPEDAGMPASAFARDAVPGAIPDAIHAAAADIPLTPAAPPAPAPTGEILIDTEPRGARVSVDGEAIGVSPITVANLTAGPHEITVTSGRGRVTRTIDVQPGPGTALVIALPAANRLASGWLAVSSAVPAQILEDGVLLGTTETPRLLLPTGRHVLDFVNDPLGFRASQTVLVAEGQTAAISLDAPNGSVHINARPWAEVFVDGRRIGDTPLGNVSVPIGVHEIVFRHPQFGEQRRTVVVGLGAPARVAVEFQP